MVGNLTFFGWLRGDLGRLADRLRSALPHSRGDLLVVILTVLNRHGITGNQITATLSLGVQSQSKLLRLAADRLVYDQRVPVDRSNRTFRGMCCGFGCFLGGESREAKSNNQASGQGNSCCS